MGADQVTDRRAERAFSYTREIGKRLGQVKGLEPANVRYPFGGA